MKKLCMLFITMAGLLYVGLLFTTIEVRAEPVTYDVTFRSMFDDANPGAAASLGPQAYDTTINLESTVTGAVSPEDDYVFAFFIVNGVVRRDLPVSHTFVVIGTLNVIAVYSKAGEHAVLFMDSNAKYLGVDYVLDGLDADDTTLTLPDKPGYILSASAKWSGSLIGILDDTVLTLQYDISSASTFTLTVTGGVGDGTYAFNEVATITPTLNGQPFSHWENDAGTILSTESTYKFTMLENKEVIAIFAETALEDAPRILLSEDLALRAEYRSYISQFYLPTGYSLVEYGMLTLTEDKVITDVNTANVILNQGFKYFAETNEFIMSMPTGSHYSIRAYLVVRDSDDIIHRYYSEQNIRYVHQGPVNLRSAADFTILNKTGTTTTPGSMITGNIGISPGPASYITGFGLILDASGEFATSTLVTGRIYASDYSVPTPDYVSVAIGDMEVAYTDAASRTPDYTELHGGDLSGQTLAPGVYFWSAAVSINTDLTLSGSATDVWIFQIGTTLTQAANVNIILTGGAVAENIVWQVATAVSIGVGAHFEGTILGMTSITLATGATMNGRLYAQTNVILDANTIN